MADGMRGHSPKKHRPAAPEDETVVGPEIWFKHFAQEGDGQALIAQWNTWGVQGQMDALRWLLRCGLDDSSQAEACLQVSEHLLVAKALDAARMEQALEEYSPEDLDDIQLDNPKAKLFMEDMRAALTDVEGAHELSPEGLTSWLSQRYHVDKCVPEHPSQENRAMGLWLADGFDVSHVSRQDFPHDLGAFLEKILSRRECQRIIAETERIGYGYTSFPQQMRGNRRLQLDDVSGALAAKIWDRIRCHVPERLSVDWLPDDGEHPAGMWEAVGCNTRFRFSKYFGSDRFETHADSLCCFGPDRFSLLTVNIYLNDLSDDQAGRTRFYLERGGEPTASAGGCAGSLVIFRQGSALHDGEVLASGLKYLMRTDVIYRRV